MFFYVIIFSLVKLSSSLVAYQCGNVDSVNKTTISLVSTPTCESPRMNMSISNHNVIVTQNIRSMRTKYQKCLVTAKHTVYHCGIFFDSPQSSGQYSEIFLVTKEECANLVRTGEYKSPIGSRQVTLSSGSSVSFDSWGYIRDGSCVPGDTLEYRGRTWYRPVRVTELTVTYGTGFATHETDSKDLVLPGGYKCLYSGSECFLPDLGNVFWTIPIPRCFDGEKEKNIIYRGKAKIAEYRGEKILQVSKSDLTYQVLLRDETVSICGYESHLTEHPNLFVTILDQHTESFPDLPPPEGSDVNTLDYLNSKIVYAVRKIQVEVEELFTMFLTERCKTERKLVASMLTIARQNPRDFAFQYFGRPGFTATTLGEAIFMYACDPTVVQVAPYDGICYNEMPVLHNGTIMFMTPRSRILIPQGTVVTCVADIRPIYKFGDRWYSHGEDSLIPHTSPEEIVIDPVVFKFESFKNLAEEGIYSRKTMSTIQNAIISPMQDEVMSSSISRSIIDHKSYLPRNYGPEVLFDVEHANRLWEKTDSYLVNLYRKMTDFGGFLTCVFFIFAVFRLACSVFAGIINFRTIRESMGFLAAIVGCLCHEIGESIKREEVPMFKKRSYDNECVIEMEESIPKASAPMYPRLSPDTII